MFHKKNDCKRQTLSDLTRFSAAGGNRPDHIISEECAPVTRRIKINQVVGEKTERTVVHGEFSVPENKPDVGNIISIDSIVKINEIDVVPNKVIIQGVIMLQIMYSDRDCGHSVHHLHSQIKFTDFVDIPGAKQGTEIVTDVIVEDVSVKEKNDNCAGEFRADAVIEIYVKVLETCATDIMTEAPEGMTARTEQLTIQEVVVENHHQSIVDGEISTVGAVPEVAKILSVDAKICIVDKRLIRDKVIVDGQLDVSLVYAAAHPEHSVHQLHSRIRFTDYVDLPGASAEMDVQVRGRVEEISVDNKEHCSESVRVSAVVELKAKVMEPKEISVVTDVEGAETEKLNLRIERVVGEKEVQVVVKDVSDFPESEPDIGKVLDVITESVEITDIDILTDKVIVKGVMNALVRYVALQPDQAVHSLCKSISFKQFAEIIGVRSGMEVEVKARTEFIKAEEENCKLIIEAVLQILVKVLDDQKLEVVSNIICPPFYPEPEPESEAEAGVQPWPHSPQGSESIVHTVRAGDTLFKIARNYPGMTVQTIKRANPGINADNLQIGQQLIIPVSHR